MHARRHAAIQPTQKEGDRSRFTVAGDVDPEEWLAAYQSFLQGEPRGHVLWDLSAGTLNVLSSADVRELARRLCALREREHAAGRFALVCPRDVDFGIGRMLVIYAGCADLGSPLQVFRDSETAWRWLSGVDAIECLRSSVELAVPGLFPRLAGAGL